MKNISSFIYVREERKPSNLHQLLKTNSLSRKTWFDITATNNTYFEWIQLYITRKQSI